MNQSKERIKYLYKQWAEGNATSSEIEELSVWLKDAGNDETFRKEIEVVLENSEPGPGYNQSDWQYLIDKIVVPDNGSIEPVHQNRINYFFRIAAAIILLVLGGTAFHTLKNKDTKNRATKTEDIQPVQKDIAPGGNKALLTLSDGKQIILDNAADGNLASEANVKVTKMSDGKIAYNTERSSTEVLYNSISTPRGGQYQLVLSDGSKVWLNAGSSLHFPITFSGKERTVELIGEGYFEIAHNVAMPFNVKVNNMNVRVLGTHFNINAYADEPAIKTTLLEGLVKINTASTNLMLQPGQQAEIDHKNNVSIRKELDTEEVIAWKNGWFNFNSLRVQDILRQISRWYNVDILYEGETTQKHFTGMVSRNSNVSEVLRIMEHAGIRFKIEGKTITVLQ